MDLSRVRLRTGRRAARRLRRVQSALAGQAASTAAARETSTAGRETSTAAGRETSTAADRESRTADGRRVSRTAGRKPPVWLPGLLRRSRVFRRSGLDASGDRDLRRSLPEALGLLAAALYAGSPPSEALHAVGTALMAAAPTIPAGRSLGGRFCQVAVSLRLGGDIRSAWAAIPEAAPGRPLAGMALALSRLDEGGAQVATALIAVATELRAEQRATSIAAARQAGVLAVLPLGLCFLPAFVLIAVLPVVVAAARQVLGT